VVTGEHSNTTILTKNDLIMGLGLPVANVAMATLMTVLIAESQNETEILTGEQRSYF